MPKNGRVVGMHRDCYGLIRAKRAQRRARPVWAPFSSNAALPAANLRPFAWHGPGRARPADFLGEDAAQLYERRMRDFRFSTTEITATEFIRRAGLTHCADAALLALRHDHRLERVKAPGNERYRRVAQMRQSGGPA